MNEQSELRQLADECYSESVQKLREGKLKNAIEMANRARDLYNEIGEKRKEALSLNLLSIVYEEYGNTSMDLSSLLAALEIAIDENAHDISAKVYNNLGSKFMYDKAYEKALTYFMRASEEFDIAEKQELNGEVDTHTFRIILNMNMATICCHTGDYQNAKRYYEEAKKEALHPANEEFAFTFQVFEGLTLWYIGEHEKAQNLIDSIMEAAHKSDYTTDYLEVFSNLVELVRSMNDYDRWLEVLEVMTAHICEEDVLILNLEMLKKWLEYYKAVGDAEKYKACCVQYYELSVQKDEADLVQKAENIELNTEMRHAIRQKQHTDSIVYLDQLTGIGNRNKMLEDSIKYIEDSILNHTTIAVGLIDVDFFKECNDTYGHVEGDDCLKRVANIIEEAVGDSGGVYRYGGDEFLLLLPELDDTGLRELGKEIKDRLKLAKIPNHNSQISEFVTVSQGYTRAYPEPGDTINHLVDLADKVLYTVKRNGRNDYRYMLYADIVKGQ